MNHRPDRVPPVAMRRRLVAGALAALAAPALRAHKAAPAPIAGFELPQPMALADFRLADAKGRPFTRASLQGHWTLLLFGFTACPDVCPTTLAQMAAVREASAKSGGPALDGVFVTIDPKRDAPARLAEYVARFDRAFTGVTGDDRAIRAFAQQFRVRYEPAAAAPYRFDHTASVSVIGPDAKLHAIFTLPLDPVRVAGDVARLDAAYAATCGRAGQPSCVRRSA